MIGFERQYRARMAGLRTNALVAAGATLWCSAAVGSLAGETNADADGFVEVRAALAAEQRDYKQRESAVSRLSLEPSVTSVRWQVHTIDHDDTEDR
jgi:uncharacterized membrane protein YhiD involved in acid resistance